MTSGDVRQQTNDSKATSLPNLWQVGVEFGVMIAVPLITFLLLGVSVDRAWGAAPWGMVTGLLLSVLLSGYLLFRRIKQLM